jgi:hypothetical protein
MIAGVVRTCKAWDFILHIQAIAGSGVSFDLFSLSFKLLSLKTK